MKSNSNDNKKIEIRNKNTSESTYFDRKDSVIMEREVYRFKVILLGEIAVGKTSIMTRFVDDKFSNEYKCNVGVEYKVRSLIIDDTTCADLQIWDTCGEERFRTLTRQYYRDALGVILIFDLTNKSSFEKLSSWVEDVFENGSKDVNIIVVGNKSDMEDERKTLFSEACNFANKYNFKYIEVSALTGNNVQLLFENLTRIMVKKEIEREKVKKKKGKIDKSHVSAKSLNITQTKKEQDEGYSENKKGTCC